MASFERPERDHILVWVIERRGAVIWTREGKSGNAGRIHHQPHPDEESAQRAYDAEISRRLKSGFALADPATPVSAPLLSRKDLTARRSRGDRVTVSGLVKRMASEVEGLGPERTLGQVANLFLTISAAPCEWRLTTLESAFDDEESVITLKAVFRQGTGDNPDDYEFEALSVRAKLLTASTQGLEDEVVLDAFTDDLLRMPAERLTRRFARALDDLAVFKSHRDARVTQLSVEYEQ